MWRQTPSTNGPWRRTSTAKAVSSRSVMYRSGKNLEVFSNSAILRQVCWRADYAEPREPWQSGKLAFNEFATLIGADSSVSKHVCHGWPPTWQTGKHKRPVGMIFRHLLLPATVTLPRPANELAR